MKFCFIFLGKEFCFVVILVESKGCIEMGSNGRKLFFLISNGWEGYIFYLG